MDLKLRFIIIYDEISGFAYECRYSSVGAMIKHLYSQKKLTIDQNDELFRLINMRNEICHGDPNKVNISNDDINRLEYYKKVLFDILGVTSTKSLFNAKLMPRNTNNPSDIIRNKFIEEKGIIHITTLNGKEYDVFLGPDGESFETIALPITPGYSFRVFDVVYDLLRRENGRARKGNGRSYKLGESGCTARTVCGAIGYEYSGKQTGDSVFDPVFIISAIMDYVGICKNTRGYLILKK